MYDRRLRFLFGGGGAICLLQLAVPPLSVWDGREAVSDEPGGLILTLLYHMWPREWLTKENVRALALRRLVGNDNNASWTWLTHLFLHDSYQHLLGNVSSFFYFGSDLYSRIGNHAYFVYIVGGLVAVCKSPLHLQQLKETSANHVSRLVPKASTWAPWLLDRPLSRINETLTLAVMDFTQEHAMMMGSSGAVMSVAGCSLVLMLNDAFEVARVFVRAFFFNPGGDAFWQRLQRAARVALPTLQQNAPRAALATALHASSALSIAKMILTDWKRFGSFDEGVIVGRAGHLQGAAFGIFCGLAICRNKGAGTPTPPPPSPPVSGHRHRLPAARPPILEARVHSGNHGDECLVCLAEPSTMALVPCGHVIFCTQCAVDIRNHGIVVCPVCRVKFTSTMRIYHP